MKNIFSKLSLALTAAAVMLFAVPSQAQAPAANTGTVVGHAQNPLGIPISAGSVKLSRDHSSTDDKSRHYDFTVPVGQDGNYKIANVPPGNDWIIFIFDPKGALLDYQNNIAVKAGQDNPANLDMTRKEYIDKMTPEEKAAMEKVRKANEGTMEANKKIANLNGMLIKARGEMKTDPADAVDQMTQATAAKPDEPILWLTLAQAQQNLGDADLVKSKKVSDDAVQKDYKGALDSYHKGIDLETTKKTPNPADLGAAYNGIGQINGKLGNIADSQAAYDAAAKALPAQAYTYYNNEAATFYNAQKMDEAAAAADRAIAVDPTKPDPYYIKAQSLIGKASVDPATQKITAPPGCVEAYNKYLELAPTGPHAEEIKGILQGIGQVVNNKYGTGKPSTPAKKK